LTEPTYTKNIRNENLEELKAYFLILMDSMAINPVVSVGSNPPNSSIEDWAAS